MKIVINDCFGGFEFNEKFLRWYFSRFSLDTEAIKELFPYEYSEIQFGDFKRDDKEVITAIEEFEMFFNESYSGDCSCISIVEIPDESTDWMLDEHDGAETIWYVVDGKIHFK